METNQDKPKNKGGRPVGSSTRLSREAIEKAREGGMLPHEFLLAIMRGEVITRKEVDEDGKITRVPESYDFEKRMDAAKAAAPYFAPKISTVEVIHGVPDDELNRIIESLATQAGIDIGAGGEGEAPAPGGQQRRSTSLEP